MQADPYLDTEIARHVWETRYRWEEGGEASIEATWQRVAHALAEVEPAERDNWEERFLSVLKGFQFLPGGRIQAGAGTGRDVTLFNCFVMGLIEDSIPGIFRSLQEGALTMQRGGGVGYDFSTIRPHGALARKTGAVASGPVSFMEVWEAMCATIQSTGARRGAMMATLRCDHPDILAFIEAKRQPGKLSHFNLSVQVTDAFMQAIEKDENWPLVFPAKRLAGEGPTLIREWPGEANAVPCRILKELPARALWESLLRATYDTGEPGVLFIDRINRLNNLWYAERISATNPCGEVPLPPYGACDLGSINLTRLVRNPFTQEASFDKDALEKITAVAVRMLDNVIDVSRFPLPQQRDAVHKARRIGLGITGLGDALVMLGLRYGSDASLAFAADIMRTMCYAAYRQSVALAKEKGSFPNFSRERYLAGPFIQKLPADIRDGIARWGIRNSHLLSIAPTGTISLLAGNVSSGIEPIFAADYERAVLDKNGVPKHFLLTDYAVRLWRKITGQSKEVPEALVTAEELPIAAHLDMQAVLQTYVDNSISKTVQVPPETSFAEFAPIYRDAYEKGLKGCTAFRPAAMPAVVLTPPQTTKLSCDITGSCE